MSEHKISETDWKRWVDLSAKALDRYLTKVLAEAGTFAKAGGTPRERYRKLTGFMEDADEVVRDVFDDQRRTSAVLKIALALKHGVITEAEIAPFSQETRERVLEERRRD